MKKRNRRRNKRRVKRSYNKSERNVNRLKFNIGVHIVILVIILLITIAACSERNVKNNTPENCEKPYQLIGNECCFDNNNNDICDRNEIVKEKEDVPKTILEDREKVGNAVKNVHINPVLNVYGKEGFNPEEVKVGVGEPLLIRNEFESLSLNGIVVLFQKEGGVGAINTPTIKHGETYKLRFEEKGTYKCWILQYPQRCKVIVE